MDKAAYLAALESRQETLFRVAWAILGNRADVADALQDTALLAWQHRHKLRDERYTGTWLTRICINASRAIARKRHFVLSLEDLAHMPSPPPDLSLALQLHALPEHLRIPLVLQYAEGMAYQDIARVLKLPVSTVRGRIARAKEMLRKELEG